jgi:hypothetical protein
LDFLEGLPPSKSATPDELNITFIECHRRIQVLRVLGDVNCYGRVLVPKILCAFPPEICQRWIVHVKRQGLSEGEVLKLMEFLGEEVDGALTAQKIRGETLDHRNYIPSAAALHVNSKQPKSERKDKHNGDPFCVFCEPKSHWAQECKRVTEVSERREKLKSAHRCILCLNPATTQEAVAEGAGLYALDSKGRITDLYATRQGPLLHLLARLNPLPSAN